MNAKRGYVPEDDRNFSPDSIKILKKASEHILYLINEGYALKQASVFVGNHYLLSERQRLAIMRSIGTDAQLSGRRSRQVSVSDLAGKEVWIDGFNVMITLEVLMDGGLLFLGMDGSIRDLAALRGTYRLIPATEKAAEMMLGLLNEAGVRKVNIFLDQPVSNSGRLKSLIADIAEKEQVGFELDIQVLKDVDRMLYGKELVITSDSIVLDHCAGWVNLAAECVRKAGIQALKVWPDSTDRLSF